jgi:uncharacterized damage-inducible protein DinB
MDTVEHLRELFAYNDWANRRIIVALKNNPCEKALKFLAHSLVTESEYYERFYGKDSTGFDFRQDLSLEQCAGLAKENAEKFEKLLRRFDDEGLGQTVSYKTSEGIAYTNNFRELLTHILFHSATHRGNIIVALRARDFTPPQIDYIIYLRETK